MFVGAGDGREQHGKSEPYRDTVRPMAKQTAGLARKPCYVVMAFMQHGEACWTICDRRTGRLVVRALDMNVAYTLAHTLNVADLTVSAQDFGAIRKPS
jgi:hypothetical protein